MFKAFEILGKLESYGVEFDEYAFNLMLKSFDFMNQPELMVTIEDSSTGLDFVIYDVSTMLEQPEDVEDFRDIVRENALDKERYEITRFVLVETRN